MIKKRERVKTILIVNVDISNTALAQYTFQHNVHGGNGTRAFLQQGRLTEFLASPF